MAAVPPELGVLFVDMNAYFASVEQMDRPGLRGRPIAVSPINNDAGCCIASSYEARAAGVKTGCRVREARRLCPGIEIVTARPDRYIEIRDAVIAAIETVLPVTAVESVDECWCRLMRNERDPGAVALVNCCSIVGTDAKKWKKALFVLRLARHAQCVGIWHG